MIGGQGRDTSKLCKAGDFGILGSRSLSLECSSCFSRARIDANVVDDREFSKFEAVDERTIGS